MVAIHADHAFEFLFHEGVARAIRADGDVGDGTLDLQHHALFVGRGEGGLGGHHEWNRMKFSPYDLMMR